MINELEIPKRGKLYPVELFRAKRKNLREIKTRLEANDHTTGDVPKAGSLLKALKFKKVNTRLGRN